MFLRSKRNRIIKKAVEKTVSEFAGRTPRLYQHFFYGAVDIGPQNLAVWYLFETDAELEAARASGLCDELRETTVKNLIAFGYPPEAFALTRQECLTGKVTLQGGSEEEQEKLRSRICRKACISFTTQEDIDNKANGDLHRYFQ